MSAPSPKTSNDTDAFFTAPLNETDPEIAAAIAKELARQRDEIELIASENIVSRAVLEAQGSVLTNKYAEGLPGKRYYGGCQFVDIAERLAIERVTKLFGCNFANVQPHSGASANAEVFFALLQPGDEFVASRKLYGGSINQFNHSYKNFGWNVAWADPDDMSTFEKAVTDKTKAIFIESIANPGGVVTDVEAVANIARKAGVPLVVDNTLATPYLCKPIDYGADVVVHSVTKFLGGHGNSIGGLIVDGGSFNWSRDNKYPMLSEPRPEYQGIVLHETFGNFAFAICCRVLGLRDLGPAMSPFNAFLLLTGVETLPLRMQRHCDNALYVAEWLSKRPEVAWVSYPGLPGDKYHELAKKYAPKGAGAVFTFGLKGGYDAGVKLVSNVELFSHLANIGDTRSLIIHPASTTHKQLSDAQKVQAGAGPDVVRLSIGLEDKEDIVADLEQAMAG